MDFSKSKVDNTTFWIGMVYRHQTQCMRPRKYVTQVEYSLLKLLFVHL